MIDLVGATRVNRVGLYKIFDDKHHLFLLELRHYQQRLHSQLLEISTNTDETVLERLRLILELVAAGTTHTNSLPTALPRGCFLLNAGIELLPQDTDIQAVVDGSRQFLESLLIALLDQEQREARCELLLHHGPRPFFCSASWSVCAR